MLEDKGMATCVFAQAHAACNGGEGSHRSEPVEAEAGDHNPGAGESANLE
jgi:hypothetical protein